MYRPLSPTPRAAVRTAVAAGSFTTLVAALQETGLDATLGDDDATFTVFAPTDEAFAALGQDAIDALLADPATLREILLFHILPGTVLDAPSVVSLIGRSVQAGNGERFTFRDEGGELFVADGRIARDGAPRPAARRRGRGRGDDAADPRPRARNDPGWARACCGCSSCRCS